jgi:hypothetical protein
MYPFKDNELQIEDELIDLKYIIVDKNTYLKANWIRHINTKHFIEFYYFL